MSTDPDRDRIARRHPDIPQDALFPPPPSGHDIGSKRNKGGEKTAPQKPIRQARCPHCWRSNKSVGVVRRAVSPTKTIDVFKDHTKAVGNARVPCSGSGQEAPDADQRST